MNMLFMIKKLEYPGAAKMLAWVANAMKKKGHEVSIVAFFSEEKGQPLCDGVNFYSLNITQGKSKLMRNTIGAFHTIVKLHSLVKKLNPDMIVSFLDSIGYIYCAVNSILGKRKMVISERVDPNQYKGIKGKIRFELMKYADGTVFQTEQAQKFFEGILTKKTAVIPNPVILKNEIKDSIDEYIDCDKRDNRIVTVGRLSIEQKRQDILLKSFEIVHKKHPELKLVIYGDGKDKEKIVKLIYQMGLHDCVTLAGKVLGIEKEILNAKAFVLTSDFEGIPNALIEALSIGVPCVSTDCSPGGARLLINNGENGFLVPRGNANAIAEGIIKIIKDKELSNRFSINGKKIVEKFSEDEITEKWEEFFVEIFNS